MTTEDTGVEPTALLFQAQYGTCIGPDCVTSPRNGATCRPLLTRLNQCCAKYTTVIFF